jgi:glycosidase
MAKKERPRTRRAVPAKEAAAPLRIAGTSQPLLYEINTRPFLRELSAQAGKRITLATIPDAVLDEWADLGFDSVWFLGVWTTGDMGRELARTHAVLGEEYKRVLPDVKTEDIQSSPYAVKAFKVARELGGEAALAKLRARLNSRGIGVILDFVANHTACDADWVVKHPEYYVEGGSDSMNSQPDLFFSAKTARGNKVIAYGRDPMYPAWTDTAQLNIFSREARQALMEQLAGIAGRCDGVRCDMAMLLLNDIFARTWGAWAEPSPSVKEEFWKEAITGLRATHPHFLFVAEAYWNREWDLQQLGFDYTYDKVLYDRLLREGAYAAREHLKAELDYQRRCLRFLENHDEQRISRVVQSEEQHYAAAVVLATVPGMKMLYEGQMEGRMLKVPVQLTRWPVEPASERTRLFYGRLLKALQDPVFKEGEWNLGSVKPAWHDNPTWQNFIVSCWHHERQGFRCAVVNYAPQNGQCYAELPAELLVESGVEFRDLLSDAVYVREKSVLESKGMYFDLPAYGFHLFEVENIRK